MRRASALFLIAALAAPAVALAQGEDAIPLAGGTLRIGIQPDWAHWNQRFGKGTPGFSDGSREPLGVDFSSDSLGITQLPFLADAQNRLRGATGLSAFSLNLGRAQLTLNNSVRVVPITVEWAPSRRFGFRAALPIVRSRVESYLAGPDSTHQGNVWLNPSLLAPGSLDAFRGQVDSALLALQREAATGPAGMRAQAQSAYNALQPLLCSLYTLAAGNASSAASPCFASGALASPVLPVDTSEAGDSITSRLTQAESQYQTLQAAYAGVGQTLPDLNESYLLPSAALDSASIRDVFSTPGGTVSGDSLTSIVRTRIGNIEVGGWLQLVDGPRWRTQLDVTLRLPTGTDDSPHNFIDLGTGTKAMGWELGLGNDMVLRPDFWLHAGLRVAGWQSSTLVRRVGPANALILPIFDTATVTRSPGMIMAVDVVPNWQLDDAFRLGLGVHWAHQARTAFSYVTAGDSARTGYAASILGDETDATSLAIGAGVTFSTVTRYDRGQSSLPYDVTASFNRVFAGSGGKVPAASAFSLHIRFYIK